MKRIAGREGVYFNNAVFLSERETADRNYSMAYFMKENKCFPPSGDLYEIMDMYFQTCSMEINTEALSVMGATLANGGNKDLLAILLGTVCTGFSFDHLDPN